MRTIIFSPAGNRDVASSRLRCHTLQENVAALGFATGWYGNAEDCDVIFFVQKRVNDEILAFAEKVKRAGGVVVFDIDDYGPNALGWLNNSPEVLARFVGLCDVVTVDTPQRKFVYEHDPVFSRCQRIWVFPDPMDYYESNWQSQLSDRCTVSTSSAMIRGCWFGNAPNIVASETFINAVAAVDGVSFTIISNAHFRDVLAQRFPACDVVAWSSDTFKETLRSFDFAFLGHNSDVEGLQKSNNKMIAALAVGTMPFVTRTPAYAETAAAVGLPELIVDSPDSLVHCIRSLDFNQLRAKLLNPASISYLDTYTPRYVAHDFVTRIAEL